MIFIRVSGDKVRIAALVQAGNQTVSSLLALRARCCLAAGHQEIHVTDEPLFHFFARYDGINQPVIEKEFGSLKSGRQVSLRGVFDDAWPSETDECLGFCEDQVAHAGVAGHHACVVGIGEDADVGKLRFGMVAECGAGFRHLHQAEHAFVHPRAAAGGDDDDGQTFFCSRFDEAREFFADDGSHRAAEKAEVHHAEGDAMCADHPDTGDDGVLEVGLLPIGRELVFIGRRACEVQNIHTDHLAIHLLKRASLDHRVNAFACADGEVVIALDANLEIRIQLFIEDHRLADRAFRPQASGDFAFAGFATGKLEFLFYERSGVARCGRRRQCRLDWINSWRLFRKCSRGHGWDINRVGRSFMRRKIQLLCLLSA